MPGQVQSLSMIRGKPLTTAFAFGSQSIRLRLTKTARLRLAEALGTEYHLTNFGANTMSTRIKPSLRKQILSIAARQEFRVHKYAWGQDTIRAAARRLEREGLLIEVRRTPKEYFYRCATTQSPSTLINSTPHESTETVSGQ